MLTFPVGLMQYSGQSGVVDPYLANVVLHLKGDGANNSTDIIDSSPTPKTITRFGDTKISTTQSKYGGSSIYFDGNGDYLTVSSSGFNLANGDYTIETWLYRSANNIGIILSTWSSSTSGYILKLNSANLQLYTSGDVPQPSSSSSPLLTNQWQHIAMVGQGNTHKGYVNGQLVVTSTDVMVTSNNLCIGALQYGGSFSNFLMGYLDSLRITKGIARYTANFNPETDTYLAY